MSVTNGNADIPFSVRNVSKRKHHDDERSTALTHYETRRDRQTLTVHASLSPF